MINLNQNRRLTGNRLWLSAFIIAVNLLPAKVLNSQDINFTQFDFNPVFLNPANTGNFIGNWRISGAYRNQWSGTTNPYNSASLAAEKPFYVFGQKIGTGIMLINDFSGAGQLSYNMVYATAGYEFVWNNNYIGTGFQVGYAFSKMNDWNTWNNIDGAFNLPSGEDIVGNTSYMDINFGLSWKRSIKIFDPELGAAFYHVNMPTLSYIGGDENLAIRYAAYLLAKTNLNDEFYVTPKFFYTGQAAASLNIFGMEFGYNLLGNRSSVKRIFGGVYVQNLLSFDAISAQIGSRVGRLDIALSYDVGMSDFSQYNRMGSFEISFIYRSISTILNSYSIPCERY